MPVVITTTVVLLLFSGGFPPFGSDRASFLNPASVREKLEKLPESASRTRALAIADIFERIGREYAANAKASMDAYAAMVAQGSSAESLIEQVRPLDEAFSRLLGELVNERQALLETLTREEWQKVFG